MTSTQVESFKQAIQRLVDQRTRELSKHFSLRVSGSVQDGGWLYVIVEPDRSGVHSEDYIEIARWVEERISISHPDENIVLIPAKPQD